MLDIVEIKQRLKDPNNLILLLEDAGFYKIRNERGNKLRFGWDEESNPTGIVLETENLSYFNFTNSSKGDILSLIQSKKQYNFNQTVKYICSVFKWNNIGHKKDIRLPFCGYYHKIYNIKNNTDFEPLEPLDESILKKYPKFCSLKFLKDGISCKTQHHFGIRYDDYTQRILIAWYTINGDFIGISGRYNGDDYEKRGESKYLAVIPFPKSRTLYGLSHNYEEIVKSKELYIFESEKAVFQMYEMGYKNCVALGKNSISDAQVRIIKSLMCEKVYLCLDEGIPEELIINEAKKLKYAGNFMKNEINYIYDKDNKYLKKGSKASCSDLGYSVRNVLRDCTCSLG